MKKLTPFQVKVYKELLSIPAGETRTYGQIAKNIGSPKGARAVGLACNKNPYPFIIPCHRVVGSNGSLTGYAFGLPLKQKLLHYEKQNKPIVSLVDEASKTFSTRFETELPEELR